MADHANHVSDGNSCISRRDLLQASGAAGVVALAGCFGSGGGNAAGTFVAPINSSPDEVHYNPYNTGQYVGGLSNLIWDYLFQYNYKTGEWHNRIGTDLQIDGTTATLSLSSDYAWMDGDPVTAEDVVTQLELERHIDYPIWNYIDGAEAVDDATIELSLQEEINPDIFIQILNREIHVKRDGEFADWVEQFENASSDQEREEISNEFLQFRYAEDDDDPMANGPYKVKDEQEGQWMLERNENYPIETNITTYKKLSVGGDQDIWQMMISDRIDGRVTQAVQADVAKQLPDTLHKIDIPAFGGLAPMFNFRNEVFATREFRQAMAFLIDRNTVEQNVNPRHQASQYISGMTDQMAENWLGTDFLENTLTSYGPGSKPDRAAEKMREAGLERSDGQWYDTNGEPIAIEWMSPPWPGPIGVSETLKQSLPDFGIEFSSTTVEPGQFFTARGNGDFQLGFNALLGGPHPYFFAQDVLEAPKTSHSAHPTDEVELPPIGQPDGSQETVNLSEMIQALAANQSDDQVTEAVKQYAWWFNQDLPYFKLTDATFPSYLSSDGFDIPDLDDDVMYVHGPAQQLFKESKEGSNQALIQTTEE
ncbi:ABC transporter substrate-binding protein [Halosolutus gelatinilyticus]|uniref:ABC transporter substrate-binding protein n=1 Tax=Halosolutus gelatinilyticus TaxID=2931975 RepID=UPI001FF4CE41|nr:ABC transporter substrate-binding protein [Halosolutus gelatinilyticus]